MGIRVKHYRALSAAAGACFVLYIAFAPQLVAQIKKSTTPEELRTDAPGEVLCFKYRSGRTYRILSKVHEDAYLNTRWKSHAEIVNRISMKTEAAHEDGSGTLDGTFMTSETSNVGANQAAFTFGEEFKSRFDRSKTGKYTISDEYFMPVVRDNPIFPETALSAGDTWEADGYEAEDLRRVFGLETPFKVPFTAHYKLLGTTDAADGTPLYVIEVKYNFRHESPPLPKVATVADLMAQPAVTKGYSNETLYWDNARGEVHHYVENFRIEIETFYGDRYVFQGIAEAEAEVQDSGEQNLEEVQAAVADLGVENVTVKRSAEGLTISMERIQFLAESTVLMESEKEKLRKIADIIAPYNNDLLVTGHCARSGEVSDQQRISEGRAKSVADYLVELGARDSYHIFTQGKGATEAIGDNNTAEGRAMNRRVEITLMDK